jgi:putative ABC transport system permease protein
VKEYESISSYTVQLKCENRAEYTGLTILNPGSNMFRIIDIYNEYFEPRSDGLLISEGLAHKMNIKAGDVIEISASELTEPDETVLIPVIRLVKSGFGSGCYLSAEGVQRYFRTTFHPNMVLLNIEDGKKDVVLSQIQNLGDITYSIESGGMLEKSEDMMSTTILMLDFLSIFSLIVGGIIIYSIISISMRERTNEFGTMIILGMDSMEVSEIIVFEQTFNFVIGILLGFPLSGLMCKIVEYAVSTDTLSVEMHISKEMYLGVFLICLTETAFSIFIIVRGILSMQLTDVLKNRV